MLAPRVLLGNRRRPFITNSLQNRNRKLMEASIGGRTDNTVSENLCSWKFVNKARGRTGAPKDPGPAVLVASDYFTVPKMRTSFWVSQ
jgi:hypothetical protein